jgi:hypothetical protein
VQIAANLNATGREAEYALRPLSDDPVAGEADDLLADMLAESALTLPL